MCGTEQISSEYFKCLLLLTLQAVSLNFEGDLDEDVHWQSDDCR